MKEYQKQYIRNLERVDTLLREGLTSGERVDEHCAIILENTHLIRVHLIPVLDDIASMQKNEVDELVEFAAALTEEDDPLDLALGYIVHDAMITYARLKKLRDLLIRELYYTGRTLFYMQEMMHESDRGLYGGLIGRLFEEAASYIDCYDEITDVQTRGYIHRSMVDRVLAYPVFGDEFEEQQKAAVIRESMKVLLDPVYREKTPELPWEIYICRSHQLRTARFCGRPADGGQVQREMLESAQYVWNRNHEYGQIRKDSEFVRWEMEYEKALYNCGAQSLGALLTHMEDAYMERLVDDYSEAGMYVNVIHVGWYALYLRQDAALVQKKKEILKYMYRMLEQYVQKAPDDDSVYTLTRALIATVKTYIEYPDGIPYKEFLMELLVRRDAQMYGFAQGVAATSATLMREMVRQDPDALVGLHDTASVDEVLSRQDELVQLAYDSGMLHDVGAALFGQMLQRAGRLWMEQEQRIYERHVCLGYRILMQCESTQEYAMTALGHCAFYNGVGGYPKEYCRTDNPNAVVTDIVSVAAYLLRLTSEQQFAAWEPLEMPAAVEKICVQRGVRFSPNVCNVLQEAVHDLAF